MQRNSVFIHALADVHATNIGEGTRIWQFSIVLEGAHIGRNCNINCHTFIENDVRLGDNVTVKAGVYLWDGIEVEDGVFIGPNVTFTNDKFPRSRQYPDQFQRVRICQGSSIGAGAIVTGGVTIGAFALVGAGSLVTRDIPAHALVMGSPARVVGWVDEEGKKLADLGHGLWVDAAGRRYEVLNSELIPR